MIDMEQLTASYWEERYSSAQTGWDIGHVSPPIKAYVETLENKKLKILVPGAGNAYEAEFLYRSGFTNVWVVDWAKAPLVNLANRCADFPQEQLLQANFFDLEQGGFDLIIEQTFFCALRPELRPTYARKMAELLKPKGKLVGLLFDAPLNSDRPPFGGTKEAYLPLFRPYFNFHTFGRCYNSIGPRQGRELFIQLQKK